MEGAGIFGVDVMLDQAGACAVLVSGSRCLVCFQALTALLVQIDDRLSGLSCRRWSLRDGLWYGTCGWRAMNLAAVAVTRSLL